MIAGPSLYNDANVLTASHYPDGNGKSGNLRREMLL